VKSPCGGGWAFIKPGFLPATCDTQIIIVIAEKQAKREFFKEIHSGKGKGELKIRVPFLSTHQL
jgi:hypothetical protein